MIARADGSPLYNFAVAIDDLDAEITHVIRGEDHLSNTPKQLLVLEAIGAPTPVYAHLPLLHGPDGKKLSKRHGAASVQELRDAGYLPEAVRNYLALLGWGDADDETLISTDELVRRFDIERVSQEPGAVRRAEAALDERPLPARARRRRADARASRRSPAATGLGEAVAISEEKIQTLADFWPLAGFIFDGPADDRGRAREVARRRRARGARRRPRGARAAAEPGLDGRGDRGGAARRRRDAAAASPSDVFQPVRVALAGTTVSPGIFETARACSAATRRCGASTRRSAYAAPPDAAHAVPPWTAGCAVAGRRASPRPRERVGGTPAIRLKHPSSPADREGESHPRDR